MASLDLLARQAAGIQPADHRAHAGAGDRIDRHVQLIEHLEHADVRRAARAAAREHQSDARRAGGAATIAPGAEAARLGMPSGAGSCATAAAPASSSAVSVIVLALCMHPRGRRADVHLST